MKAFIIMPISTPDQYLHQYSNDKDHFVHVLDYLFVPVMEKLGYETTRPIAEGSELIHSRIVSNLESADLVLCDISTLNANVFFELGIRTALNKPVCLVKDEHTKGIPFDTSLINIFDYQSRLDPWLLSKSKDDLERHVKASAPNAGADNALWSIFGLKSVASEQPALTETKENEILKLKIEFLNEKIENMNLKQAIPETAAMFQAAYIKCSNCSYGFEVTGQHFGYTSHIAASLASATVLGGPNIPATNVVKCPKCGSLNKLS